MRQREMFVIAIALSILAGFLTGLFLWNYFREYDAPVLASVAEPTSTLPNPAVSTVMPTITPTIVPTATNAPQLRARLSHYWPAWGPPNCIGINWDGVTCASLLTDSKQWQHWSYYADKQSTACPKEFKLGTIFRIEGYGDYKCVDRGGAINILPDGTFFLDLMTPHIPYIKGGEVVRDQYSPMGSYVVNVSIVEN